MMNRFCGNESLFCEFVRREKVVRLSAKSENIDDARPARQTEITTKRSGRHAVLERIIIWIVCSKSVNVT